MHCTLSLVVGVLGRFAQAQVNIYPFDLTPSPTGLDDSCIAAINSTIDCDSAITGLAFQDYYGSLSNATLQDSVCAGTCATALSSYRKNVIDVCGVDAEMQDGYPATYVGDLISSYYNLTCLTDPSTGEYCTDYISSVNSTIEEADTSLESLDSSTLCSPCMLSLLQNRQSTPFSGYDASTATTWASIQSICGVTYPTEVQAPAASPTSVYGYANSSYSSVTCLSGNNYAVVSGDTCQAIAAASNVATGTLITLNQLLPGCTDLQVGQKLCLPQSCTTYTVASGDTCFSIASAAGISYLNLLSWNPSINNVCTNLIADTEVCVSIPGGSVWNGTTIAGATATQTAAYATTTATAPGATASGTTPGCGKYYQVVTGDICQLVALNNSITVSTFEAINPSVDEGCDNLVPGLYYCVFPTADWNVTSGSGSSSTTVSPPAPTATGTTSSCYEWYVIQSEDSCYNVEQSFGITFEQLQSWNPSLDSDCSNLVLGDAYCVSGASSTSSGTSTSTAAQATVAAPTTTPSGTTSSCYEWHTVVEGDYCYLLETDYNITFEQFQTWNPSIDDACAGLLLGEAYCVDGPSI